MVKWLFVVALVGCGSDHDTGVDASGGSGSADAAIDAPVEGPFGDRMPQVVGGAGGAGIITAPKVIAITYANDPLRTDYEHFFTQYAASAAWTAQAAEYGIGALTVAPPGELAANAPASLTENDLIANVLKPNLTGAAPAWGAPDANTLYEISIPAALAYDDGTGAKCCQDYYGYHYDTKINNVDVPFAINCACADSLTALQNLTETANHETLEAASDPLGLGFAQADDDHAGWTYTTDGEIGDLCEYADTASFLMPTGMSYAIQRTWSNAEARAGHDPCVPGANADYYQTIPDAFDTGNVTIFGSHSATHLTKIAKGATGTITLHVYANGSYTGPFKITLEDWNSQFQGPALLTFVQPTGTFMAGDTVTVQTTVVNTDSQLGNAAEAYQINTKPMTGGGATTYFYGLVGQ